MPKYDSIQVAEARRLVQSGDALLVCAYESEEKFKKNCLEGALSLQEFKEKEGEIPRDQEIIFYCN
ncbi:rhodanese-like domain-containing protein [Desulfopila inferna]|uniref:rhodanese-like domain-containing protein n=1 Tax=Desulfopila inferna TaxID=468528 RepID=UPI0019635B8C|nr:hypothetical protein [Desulfopila inferna]MBM9605658.1 hypothetical protein [Desulfopila inferna]